MPAKKRRQLGVPVASDAGLAEVTELALDLPPELLGVTPKTFSSALKLAGNRPPDNSTTAVKIPYATRLSALFARVIAAGLYGLAPEIFKGVRTGEQSVGKRGAGKKIDVLVATERQGMTLNVSIKTQSFRDFAKGKSRTTKAYCHNTTRIIDQELQFEARRSHQLFPMAVLVAVVFLPADACFDANPLWEDVKKRTDSHCSSAAEFAQRLRPYSGRSSLRDIEQEMRFEAAFIGLHGLGAAGVRRRMKSVDPDVCFFDVTTDLPRNDLPATVLSFEDFLAQVRSHYERRWKTRRSWADPSS